MNGSTRTVIRSAGPPLKPSSDRRRKALGQHFLVDRQIPPRILRAAEVGPEDTILEIGPGAGALTRHLVGTAKVVVAVELDPELAKSLPARLGAPPNLRVVEEDARTVDPSRILGGGVSYKLVGSLPYYAANPIIRHFLEQAEPKPRLMVVMVQKEVARSMAALDGKMSLLAVGIHFYAKPRIICDVPPSAFSPSPKVTSTVVRLDPHQDQPVDPSLADGFFRVVRAGFSAPRKQLRNSLGLGLGIPVTESQRLLQLASVDATRRPGSLGLNEWKMLWHTILDEGHSLATRPA